MSNRSRKNFAEEILERIEKYAGKIYGFELIISSKGGDKVFNEGFLAGKAFMKSEVQRIIKEKVRSLNGGKWSNF